jgi:hypothetical protein
VSPAQAARHRLATSAAAGRAARPNVVRAIAVLHPGSVETLAAWRDRFVGIAGPVAESGPQCLQCGVTAA